MQDHALDFQIDSQVAHVRATAVPMLAVLFTLYMLASPTPYVEPDPHCMAPLIMVICVAPTCSPGGGDICTPSCAINDCPTPPGNATAVCNAGVCELLCTRVADCPPRATCVSRQNMPPVCLYGV